MDAEQVHYAVTGNAGRAGGLSLQAHAELPPCLAKAMVFFLTTSQSDLRDS